MKNYLILAIFIFICSFQVQFANGQTETTLNRQTEPFKTSLSADSVKNQINKDVVINIAMIESFRRCYDKIEVIDWAYMFKGASNSELGLIYMAYRRMQTNGEVNNTKSLIAEVTKVRSEADAKSSIKTELVIKKSSNSAKIADNNYAYTSSELANTK